MQGYLEFHSEEVFNMLALQWDKDSALQASFDDGYEDGFENGFENGVQVGQSKGVESVALNLLNMGMSVEQVQDATKLSFERIKELANTSI